MSKKVLLKSNLRQAVAVMICVMTVIIFGSTVRAQEQPQNQRLKDLEKKLEKLQKEMQKLKQEQAKKPEKEKTSMSEEDIATIKKAAERLNDPTTQRLLSADSWLQKFTLGGYGEMHANFNQGSDEDQFDLHRLVFYYYSA